MVDISLTSLVRAYKKIETWYSVCVHAPAGCRRVMSVRHAEDVDVGAAAELLRR